MAVFATELVCGKCHNGMGAVIFEKEESSNTFTQSNNELLCEGCFRELKNAVKDSKTPPRKNALSHAITASSKKKIRLAII